ncbi:carbohydrate kinase [Agromyces intestinalis]|uniref:Carbohydrate kinase n=1 Tax=Agromyces intestinalis TaxID=2592652 RepID=A0A5C1YGC8_9MICO|nr:carbohydrate kinase [Agromyces intestinalis]QEO13812.1 carbohydrate kinase [Agromyces intestinalis]
MNASAPTPDVLVVGEALVDIVHRADDSIDESPGGSPANVALALGRLGRSPRLLTSIGDDPHGRSVRAWLAASEVSVHGLPATRTSTALARLDAQGAATYEFDLEWSVDTSNVATADALHVGSIAATLEPGATAVADLLDRHHDRALVTYDPNIRPSLIDDREAVRRQVRSLIARADVIKASDEDVVWLHPGEDIADVARRWSRSGPALVVITSGASGCFAVAPGFELSVPAIAVEVVDTVGAGDTFMAALIDGLLGAGAFGVDARAAIASLEKGRLTELLHRSALAASVTVSRPGADPPLLEELMAAAGVR